MGSIQDSLAKNLVAFRKRRNLSQHALAALAEVSRGTIAKLETAAGGATIEMIGRLANVLGVEQTDLVADPETAGLVRRGNFLFSAFMFMPDFLGKSELLIRALKAQEDMDFEPGLPKFLDAPKLRPEVQRILELAMKADKNTLKLTIETLEDGLESQAHQSRESRPSRSSKASGERD